MTVYAQKYIGEPEKLVLLEEAEDWVGVPRRWGMMALGEYQLEVEDRTTYPNLLWPEMKWVEDCGFWGGQKAAIDGVMQAFRNGDHGALLEAACGTGKTFMALKIAEALQTSALVLVHKDDLAQQWWDTVFPSTEEDEVTLKKPAFWPGIQVGHVQGDEFDYKSKHVVTAMAQTLYSRMDEIPPEFWSSFGLVIYDEGHRYSAKTFEAVQRLPMARYRLGISATWRRADRLEKIWHWHIGVVKGRAKVERLSGEYVQILWRTGLTEERFRRGSFLNKAAMLTAVTKDKKYNEWLVEQLWQAMKAGRKLLLVSDRVGHCEELLKYLRLKCLEDGIIADAGLYIGKVRKDELVRAKKRQIIIATYRKMSEGTDIPALDTLILATPRVDIEQIVGRIQRPKGGKKKLLVVDPVFSTKYYQALGHKRIRVYKKLGFRKQEKKL